MSDLNEIRKRLEAELSERTERAERIDSRLSQPGNADWEEQATERENDEVLESLGSQLLREISQIKQALLQIDEGTYGICSRCGSQIAPQRMEILPHATTCTSCA